MSFFEVKQSGVGHWGLYEGRLSVSLRVVTAPKRVSSSEWSLPIVALLRCSSSTLTVGGPGPGPCFPLDFPPRPLVLALAPKSVCPEPPRSRDWCSTISLGACPPAVCCGRCCQLSHCCRLSLSSRMWSWICVSTRTTQLSAFWFSEINSRTCPISSCSLCEPD